MANPATINDIIKVNASIAGGGGVSLQSFSDPVFVSTFAVSADFDVRVRAYAGTLSEMQASLVADGFSANDPAYRQITAAGIQQGPPDLIYIGRSDPADINYAESLTAIWDEAAANDQSLYFACVDERDTAAIEEIADWVNQRDFVFYMAATAASSVYNNQPGNVCANIIAKGYDTTALVWHDAPVASNFAPAKLESLVGPFVLPSVSGDFKARIDGGAEQTFTLVANAATVTGSNTGPFVVADGDDFQVTIDGGTLQAIVASLLPAETTSAFETFNVTPGSTLQTSFNGAAPANSNFAGTAGSVTTADEPYAFIALDSVTFDIDGTGNQVVNFAIADTTRALVIAALSAQLTGVTIADTGTGITITSLVVGTDSDVEIVAGSANALAELGLVVGNNAGTGFAGDFTQVTASELQIKLDADYVDGNVTVNGSQVQIATVKVGTAAAVRVLDSVANDALGFSTSEFRGAGDFADGSAVSTTDMVAWLSDQLFGTTTIYDANAVNLSTRSRGSLSQIDIAASTLGTTLGFPVAITASVGSNVGNASAVTASEIRDVIALTIVDGTTAAAQSKFSISSLVNGPTSTVELTGGSYADALFGSGGVFTVAGTGTDEDYIDCAYVGRMATLPLDAPNGQSTWDNAPLNGIFVDTIPANTRKILHETLKVNTYERRLGRNEMHFGTVLFGNANTYRYIDQRVSLDWGWARSVETFKTTLNQLADQKAKAPNTDDGIELLANDWDRLLQSGETNGHWIYDGSTITSATDTGITIPTRAQQTAANVSLRKVSGFKARFQFLDAIHRAEADLNLTSFAEFNVAV